MKLLELYSGTGSVGHVVKKAFGGAEIVSIDIHPKYNPTHATDILKWDYTRYPVGYFDMVWASPPCTEYTIAKRVGARNLKQADKTVKWTLRIIDYLKPRWWFVENPRGGGLLDKRPFMKCFETMKHRCTCCHYGAAFRKPTNIWSNVQNLNLRCCSKNDRCRDKRLNGYHPQVAQHSASSDTRHEQQRGAGSAEKIYPVPPKLVRHIVSQLLVT
jgi:hypothetical protein